MTKPKNNEIKEEENGNMIYQRDSDGFEIWYEYDEHNRLIRRRDSEGYDRRIERGKL